MTLSSRDPHLGQRIVWKLHLPYHSLWRQYFFEVARASGLRCSWIASGTHAISNTRWSWRIDATACNTIHANKCKPGKRAQHVTDRGWLGLVRRFGEQKAHGAFRSMNCSTPESSFSGSTFLF